MSEAADSDGSAVRPEARLGVALRRARQERGLSLRALAGRLHRAHSNLHDYEKGNRLPPVEVVQGYETILEVAPGTLTSLHREVADELENEGFEHGRDEHGPRPYGQRRLDADSLPRRVAGPEPSPTHRRRSVLIAAAIVAAVAVGLAWRATRDGGRFDLAAVGDRLTLGDYTGDGKADVAMAYDLGDGTMRIYRWISTGSKLTETSPSKSIRLGAVAGRTASGDVDGDGKDDLVMASQDDSMFSFHVWFGGSRYAGRWYTGGSFNLAAVGGRFTVGDYSGDGKADVAMAYDAGDGTMRMHLWNSTGSGFAELAPSSQSLGLSAVEDRMGSGDVDGDGRADIVMAYRNPDGTFNYHVWSGGSSYLGKWYTSGQFNLSLVGDRLTVGDFTGDGKADVAMAYDLGNAQMRLHRWTSSGSSFDGLTRYDSHGFNVDNVAGRMASGDVNADGKDDIVMAYQNLDGTFSFHVWSGGSSFVGRWYTSGR
ncbi:MAG: FG-GAP-like repeat-containing protein [Actinomycetota bacterium]|nr:FG-GAP-like repeat-containing protein [Actinomycetota bacterium]